MGIVRWILAALERAIMWLLVLAIVVAIVAIVVMKLAADLGVRFTV